MKIHKIEFALKKEVKNLDPKELKYLKIHDILTIFFIIKNKVLKNK